MKESGFSLIETVVACMILCLVISMVVPIFSETNGDTRSMVIAAKARSIAQDQLEKLLASKLSGLTKTTTLILASKSNEVNYEVISTTKPIKPNLHELEVMVKWRDLTKKDYQFSLHTYLYQK